MIRIYGNQHGHWLTFTGKDAKNWKKLVKITGKTDNELLMEAIKLYESKTRV